MFWAQSDKSVWFVVGGWNSIMCAVHRSTGNGRQNGLKLYSLWWDLFRRNSITWLEPLSDRQSESNANSCNTCNRCRQSTKPNLPLDVRLTESGVQGPLRSSELEEFVQKWRSSWICIFRLFQCSLQHNGAVTVFHCFHLTECIPKQRELNKR